MPQARVQVVEEGGQAQVEVLVVLPSGDMTGAADDAARDAIANNGTMALDTGGNKIWVKISGTWRSVGVA